MKTHWGCLKIACIFTGLLVTGCDTVAELTFQDEQLIELNPVGLLPAGCSQADADSDAVLRFSVLTSFNEMMMPGKRYSAFGDLLVAGQNFKASHITLSDGLALQRRRKLFVERFEFIKTSFVFLRRINVWIIIKNCNIKILIQILKDIRGTRATAGVQEKPRL